MCLPYCVGPPASCEGGQHEREQPVAANEPERLSGLSAWLLFPESFGASIDGGDATPRKEAAAKVTEKTAWSQNPRLTELSMSGDVWTLLQRLHALIHLDLAETALKALEHLQERTPLRGRRCRGGPAPTRLPPRPGRTGPPSPRRTPQAKRAEKKPEFSAELWSGSLRPGDRIQEVGTAQHCFPELRLPLQHLLRKPRGGWL